jgi:hypothetical protein
MNFLLRAEGFLRPTQPRCRPGPRRTRLFLGRMAFAALSVVSLTACGQLTEPAPSPTVTVTVTKTLAGPAAPARSTPSPTSAGLSRRYDLGTVLSTREIDQQTWVELDRWTLRNTPDSVIAREGITLDPHYGSKYLNYSDSKTYWSPVDPDALLVWHECIPRPGPGMPGLASAPEAAEQWLQRPDRMEVLLVTYDDFGTITRFDSEASCPAKPAQGP